MKELKELKELREFLDEPSGKAERKTYVLQLQFLAPRGNHKGKHKGITSEKTIVLNSFNSFNSFNSLTL